MLRKKGPIAEAGVRKWLIILYILLILSFKGSDVIDGAQDRDVIDLLGRNVEFSKLFGSTTLVLFFSPFNSYHKNTLSYAEVLYDKYRERGLEIIGVCEIIEKEIVSYVEEGLITFPLVADSSNKIKGYLGGNYSTGSTFLFDSAGNSIFQSRNVLLDEHSLRQLIEKKITGGITYFNEPPTPDLAYIEDKLKKSELLDIRTREVDTIDAFSSEYLIITICYSMCFECRAKNRFHTLNSVYNKASALKKELYCDIIIIYDNIVSSADLFNWEKSMPIPFRVFAANDVLPDEMKYVTDSSKRADPLTVVMNRERRIIYSDAGATPESRIYEQLISIVKSKRVE